MRCSTVNKNNGNILLIGFFISVSVVALNSVYTKHVAIVQTILMASKMVPLLIIIVVGLIQFFVYGEKENMKAPFANSNLSVESICAALLIGSFNYGGW